MELEEVMKSIEGLAEEVRQLREQLSGTTFTGKFSHEHLVISTSEQSSVEYGDTTKGGRGKVKVYLDPANVEDGRKKVKNAVALLRELGKEYDRE